MELDLHLQAAGKSLHMIPRMMGGGLQSMRLIQELQQSKNATERRGKGWIISFETTAAISTGKRTLSTHLNRCIMTCVCVCGWDVQDAGIDRGLSINYR